MCSNSIKKIIFVIRFLLALGLVHLVQGSSASEFKSLFFAGRQRSLNCAFVSIETVAQRCSVKKVFLEILQNSLEKTCARVSFFNKVAATLLKKRLWHRCFPVNLAKFPRTRFFTEHLWWLLLTERLPANHVNQKGHKKGKDEGLSGNQSLFINQSLRLNSVCYFRNEQFLHKWCNQSQN